MSESIKSNVYLVTLIFIFLYISVSYNACSEVDFKKIQRVDQSGFGFTGPGIVINGGADYSKESLVNLTLFAPNANEMSISNDPSCSTGKWEPYAQSSPWVLGSENSEAFVFVKYREVEGSETDCIKDGIIHDNIGPFVTFKNPQNIFSKRNSMTVDFLVEDNLSGVQEISCSQSVDGGFSDCNGSQAIINLPEGGQSFFVKAKDKAGNESLPVSYNWTVDLTAAVVTLNLVPPQRTGLTDAEFSFSGSDNISGINKFECYLKNGSDSAQWTTCTSPYSQSQLKEGASTLQIRATDNAGNVSDPVIYDWTIDLTAPTVTITKYPDPVSNQSTAMFEFSGLDGQAPIVEFLCSLENESNYEKCTSPMSYGQLPEGQHFFYVKGKDQADNMSAPAVYTWMIDLTKPTVAFTSMPPAFSPLTEGRFQFVATDNGGGINRIECDLNGSGYKICTSPYLAQNLKEGPQDFRVRAYDNAGNVSPEIGYSWLVDLRPPSVQVVSAPQPLTADTFASFEFSGQDTGSGVSHFECKLDANPLFAQCVSPTDFDNLSSGIHNFYVRAQDKAGNTSDPVVYQWTVDAEPPLITFIMYPQNSVNLGDPVDLLFKVEDSGSGVQNYECLMDGVAELNCADDIVLTFVNLTLGDHTFKVAVEDTLGNASVKEVIFNISQLTTPKVQNHQVRKNNQVDILFVVDNSGSMKAEQTNMAERIDGFLTEIEGLDWHIAVTTTDVETGSSQFMDGLLSELDGLSGEYVLTSTVDSAIAQTVLGNTIQREEKGSPNEEGIYATYRSLERLFDMSSENDPLRQFYRSDAHFSVVLISDEDETIYKSDHKNQPQDLVNKVKGYWPEKNFSFNSIIAKPNDKDCLDGEGYRYGVLYNQMSELTGGIVGSVCEPNYAQQLQDIGESVKDLQKSITLVCGPVDVTGDGQPDLTVTYQPEGITEYVDYPDTFVIDQLRVTFSGNLLPGDYKLEYNCL